MKRLLAIAILAMVVLLSCEAQTKIIVGSTITVTWDAPALGTIPVSEVSYEVVVQPRPSGTLVLVGTTTALEQVVIFSTEGPYKIGVRTKRITADATVLYSGYFWGDVDGTETWYVVYYAAPPKVIRVRIK
jgi:hypothetical protein